MGANASKPVRTAAGAAKRQYPKQAAPPPRPTPKAPRETKPPQPPQPPQQPQPTPSAPKAPPAQTPSHAAQGPTYHSKEEASTVKSNAIDLDGRDPDFAASLRSIGPVDPTQGFPHGSANLGSMQTVFPSASSPAWLVHTARNRLNKIAAEEEERIKSGRYGDRQFVDAFQIQQALQMRDAQNLPPREIEGILGLKPGLVDKLGQKGIVSRISLG
ncbi:hypothetical protein N7532_009450 [Penicillium argentinense]|uniref:Helix-turn-helix domain-containing protein n=1 Tax=Penicillium argentinense TaxID=1131581 RepID=A0A9W9K2Z9_9EURO|nr:uncharacterized protein N7532_009450 [Penicillium argentinense]KAJ5090766.1 hypothetical protein N7532_009450 [Penicillium argentinense]